MAVKEDMRKWLGLATKGLCDDARTRVSREIVDHYDDCVAAELGRGRTVVEAHSAAMESLGSPAMARDAYLKTYLTSWEARCLGHRANTDTVRGALWYAAAMGLMACWSASTSFLTFAVLFLISASYFAFFRWELTTVHANALRRQGRRRLAWLLTHAASDYYLYCVLLFICGGTKTAVFDQHSAQRMLAVVGLLEVSAVCRSVALELKLRRLNYPNDQLGA